jgi:hypothetical protein
LIFFSLIDYQIQRNLLKQKKIKGQALEQNSTKEGQLCMQACPGGHGGISQSTELS